jgi:hypothetical protein
MGMAGTFFQWQLSNWGYGKESWMQNLPGLKKSGDLHRPTVQDLSFIRLLTLAGHFTFQA